MKRLIIAIILLMIAAVLSTTEYIYIKNLNQNTCDNLDKSGYYISEKEYTKAVEILNKTKSEWNNSRKILNTFMIHSESYRIRENLEELYELAKNKKDFEFEVLKNKTKRQLLSIKESELPYLDNIL